MSDFAPAFEKLMDDEGGNRADGGFWRDPRGGATKFGITQRFLDDLGDPRRVQDLTRDDARELYRVHFWEEYRIGLLGDQDLANEFLSMAVVSGPSPATRCLQRALCAVRADPAFVKDDGVLGPKTRRALGLVSPCCLRAAYRAEQAGFLRDLDDPAMERGWTARAYR